MFCFDGITLLILKFLAAASDDWGQEQRKTLCWVLRVDGGSGQQLPVRLALYVVLASRINEAQTLARRGLFALFRRRMPAATDQMLQRYIDDKIHEHQRNQRQLGRRAPDYVTTLLHIATAFDIEML